MTFILNLGKQWLRRGKSLNTPCCHLSLPNLHMLTSFSPRWCCGEEGPVSVCPPFVSKCSQGGSSQEIGSWAFSSVAEMARLAQHGCLLLCCCDMLPFKQSLVNLFGTCCSLAEDPETFTILICFPLYPEPLCSPAGEAMN